MQYIRASYNYYYYYLIHNNTTSLIPPPNRMEQQDALADKVSRQIPMVSADLDTIQSRIHDAEGKADKLTAADVRTMIDDIESASKVRENKDV